VVSVRQSTVDSFLPRIEDNKGTHLKTHLTVCRFQIRERNHLFFVLARTARELQLRNLIFGVNLFVLCNSGPFPLLRCLLLPFLALVQHTRNFIRSRSPAIGLSQHACSTRTNITR